MQIFFKKTSLRQAIRCSALTLAFVSTLVSAQTQSSPVQVAPESSAPTSAATPAAPTSPVAASPIAASQATAPPSAALPNAPDVLLAPSAPVAPSASLASIAGTVEDTRGYVLDHATVTLTGPGLPNPSVQQTSLDGSFIFHNLASGTFEILVTSPGLGDVTSDVIVLAAGQRLALFPLVLGVPTTSSIVHVSASQFEVAQAQVQMEEKQRVLGIVPNFYSSYVWHAAPLTPRLKFNLAFRSVIDPIAFVASGGVAGVEQLTDTFPGYGRGTQGYLKRFGAAYADNVIGRMLGSAVLPTVFHQDPRYFYKGKGSIRSRAMYAIGAALITRGDNGRNQPNYSHILGNFMAAGISNVYRAPRDRSATLTIRNGAIITGANAFANLVREFLLRPVTPHVPTYDQGQR